MKNSPRWLLGGVGLCLLASALPAAVLNDGTTTAGLQEFTVDAPDPGSRGRLDPQTNGTLQVTATREFHLFYDHTVWYAQGAALTSGVYTLSASIQAGTATSKSQSGVAGWVSLVSSNALALTLIPTGLDQGFEVSLLDLVMAERRFDHLYTLQGVPASEVDARAAFGANYDPATNTTLKLAFSAPTAADLQALTNAATARLTASFWQSPAGTPVEVGTRLELLTDLPAPAPESHRVGYYGVWFDFNRVTDAVVAWVDNLTLEGGFAPVNIPPQVTLSSPTNGASFSEGTLVSLVAQAVDLDGFISQVEFFEGNTSLGVVTQPSEGNTFTLHWRAAGVAMHSIYAVTRDDQSASGTSAAVEFAVTQSEAPPTLTYSAAGGTLTLNWEQSGFTLQSTPSLTAPNWSNLSTTGNQYSESLASAAAKFFRLVR